MVENRKAIVVIFLILIFSIMNNNAYCGWVDFREAVLDNTVRKVPGGKEAEKQYKKKVEKPVVKPVIDGAIHAGEELFDEISDVFGSSSEKDREVIKKGKLGDGIWFLLGPKGNVRIDNQFTILSKTSAKLFISCTTADGKNKGHVYQNKMALGGDILNQGGHVDEKNFTNTLVYSSDTYLIGRREIRFSTRSKSPWTLITVHGDFKVKPLIALGFGGNVGLIITDGHGGSAIIPIKHLPQKEETIKHRKKIVRQPAGYYENLDRYEGAAESAHMLFEALNNAANDYGVNNYVKKNIKLWKKLISENPNSGVLLDVKIYAHHEGQRVVGGTSLVGVSDTKLSAMEVGLSTPGITAAPLEHLLLDSGGSYLLWLTIKNDKLQIEKIQGNMRKALMNKAMSNIKSNKSK
jgi:hypothetical protein